MTSSAWLRAATAALGPVPDDYLAFDVETTGFSRTKDLLVQFGWVRVAGRKVVEAGEFLVDWVNHPTPAGVSDLSERILRTKQAVEYREGRPTGAVYPISIDRLRHDGVPPRAALDRIAAVFDPALPGSGAVVCHNGVACDLPFLDAFVTRLGGRTPAPPVYVDTMALERALQLRPPLKPGERWSEFSRRGCYLGGNTVRSGLVDHCAVKYALADRHGVDLSYHHEAGFDARLTHLILEEQRALLSKD